jgi:tetratricopeptide (TPR) repeat protein
MRVRPLMASLAFLAIGASGCVTVPDWQTDSREPVELRDVPFAAQTTDQCGPASLSMLLSQAGVNAPVDALRERVYLPEREGALQVELLAATREAGRVALAVRPNPHDLLAHLDAGRAVLVLQDLRVAWRSRWHYAVVVGYLPAEQAFVLRSGPNPRLLMKRKAFLKSWQRGGNWGMVALPPDDIPANVSENEYLRAVAAFESASPHQLAYEAYAAALKRWPDSIGARFGMANMLYAQNDLHHALLLFVSIVDAHPDYLSASNNLALLYRDLGQRQQALDSINAAIGRAEQSTLLPALLETRQEILAQ